LLQIEEIKQDEIKYNLFAITAVMHNGI